MGKRKCREAALREAETDGPSGRWGSPVCPSGLHRPGQFPGRDRFLQLLLGGFREGLDAPFSILILFQCPPGQHPRASIPKGSSAGELIQHRGQRQAWAGGQGAGRPGLTPFPFRPRSLGLIPSSLRPRGPAPSPSFLRPRSPAPSPSFLRPRGPGPQPAPHSDPGVQPPPPPPSAPSQPLLPRNPLFGCLYLLYRSLGSCPSHSSDTLSPSP